MLGDTPEYPTGSLKVLVGRREREERVEREDDNNKRNGEKREGGKRRGRIPPSPAPFSKKKQSSLAHHSVLTARSIFESRTVTRSH